MHNILHVTKIWFRKCMNDFVVNKLKLNKTTVDDWFMFCCEVCRNAIVNDRVKIRRVNVVEIDVSKFGKMNYGQS